MAGITYAAHDEKTRVGKRLAAVLKKCHGPKAEAGVTVDLLAAYGPQDEAGETKGPALKIGGYRCKAAVKINSLKDRALGQGDALIVFDGDQEPEWSDAELDAILDHELSHLELVTDSYGTVKRDDLERPRLRIALHDWQFGWFDAVARRHKDSATEVMQARELFADEERRQLYLGFMTEA